MVSWTERACFWKCGEVSVEHILHPFHEIREHTVSFCAQQCGFWHQTDWVWSNWCARQQSFRRGQNYLQCNNMADKIPGVFVGNTQCKELTLSSNKLTHVRNGVLSLQILDLGENLITELSSGMCPPSRNSGLTDTISTHLMMVFSPIWVTFEFSFLTEITSEILHRWNKICQS